MPQASTSLEHIVMHHEEEIDKVKDNYHSLDKKVDRIDSNILSILDKLDEFSNNNDKLEQRIRELEDDDTLEKRVETLEGLHKRREQLVGILYRFCNIIYKIRWGLFVVFLLSFAVDIDFRVQNPQVMNYLFAKLPPIFK